MLKYETIERLSQSLFYSRKNHKSYSIISRQLKNDDSLSVNDIEYINKGLVFKTYNKPTGMAFLNAVIKDNPVINSYNIKSSGTFQPDMGTNDDRLVYRSERDKSTLFTNSRINVRDVEHIIEKDTVIFAKDDIPLSFNMEPEILNRSLVLNKKNSLYSDANKISTLNVNLIGDNDKYLYPSMNTNLDKSDNLSYDGLLFTMGVESDMNTLQDIKRDIKKISSIIRIPLTQNLEIKHSQKQIRVFVKDYGLGNGTGGVGDLEITLEVYKLTEMRFKLPKGYIDGLVPSGIAHAEDDTLVVFTRELGEVTLYTNKGSIKVRTLPGMKINKRRIVGEEADMFGQS